MVSIQKYNDLTEGASLALKYRLFVNGWSLVHNLHWFKKHGASLKKQYEHCQLLIAFDGTEPIGILLCDSVCSVSVFIRKSFRKQGIGSQLIDALRAELSVKAQKELNAGYGVQGSLTFWAKNFINAPDI